jgi:hypothetical protein
MFIIYNLRGLFGVDDGGFTSLFLSVILSIFIHYFISRPIHSTPFLSHKHLQEIVYGDYQNEIDINICLCGSKPM